MPRMLFGGPGPFRSSGSFGSSGTFGGPGPFGEPGHSGRPGHLGGNGAHKWQQCPLVSQAGLLKLIWWAPSKFWALKSGSEATNF